jgi:hypothetical protein
MRDTPLSSAKIWNGRSTLRFMHAATELVLPVFGGSDVALA